MILTKNEDFESSRFLLKYFLHIESTIIDP